MLSPGKEYWMEGNRILVFESILIYQQFHPEPLTHHPEPLTPHPEPVEGLHPLPIILSPLPIILVSYPSS